MKWLLVIIFVSAEPDIDRDETIRFATESECLAVARAFVEMHPEFELLEGADERKVGTLLLRSYVECIPRYPD